MHCILYDKVFSIGFSAVASAAFMSRYFSGQLSFDCSPVIKSGLHKEQAAEENAAAKRQSRAVAARKAHNLEVTGSTPVSATAWSVAL